MAQHNYFGFTPAGTQYPPQPSAYATGQTTYVPAGQPYGTPGRPAAAAYSGYDTGTPTAYAYAPTPPARSAVVTVAVTPQYQAVQVKPTYTSGYTTGTSRPVNTAVAPVPKPASVSNYSYVATSTHGQSYNSHNQNSSYNTSSGSGAPSSSANNYSGNSNYDAALYSAATNYYQQQQSTVNKVAVNTGSPWFGKKDNVNSMMGSQKKNFFGKPRPQAPKPQQLHYCDVCKISCAGPQTYREHLEGQKHKKKEAVIKSGTAPSNVKAGQSQLKCDLCDVTCTGSDAYTAHIRGSKHNKVIKLHTRLGKHIPSSEPTIVTAGDGSPPNGSVGTAAAKPAAAKKVVTTPQIRFVGGSQLKSLATGELKEDAKSDTPTSTPATPASGEGQESLLPGEKIIQPVGHEYIEETTNEGGKVVNFNCKLCDCKFNDPNAKDMHMKGRRHRLNYKRKVDPSLVVEVKTNAKNKRDMLDGRGRGRDMHPPEDEMRLLEQDRFMEERRFADYSSRQPETFNDRHIVTKHSSIYPTESELQAVQNIVTACEKALKLVSDTVAEEGQPKQEGSDTTAAEIVRQLKGVMRVGELAKGLLLRNNLNVELVLLCTDKPSKSLLSRVCDALPGRLKEVSEESFTVTKSIKDAAIIVTSVSTPPTRCSIILTSPVVREESQAENAVVAEPSDALDRQKCLDALAALRHAKWFQARASNLPSCVLLLRVLRELKSRVDKLANVSGWAIELLLERCLSTAMSTLGPGDAMRRFFECIASGILLPGSPGLSDPCEKEPVDVFAKLTGQQREDITAFAQLCLRQIAFHQIHKILDMESMPFRKDRTTAARKRPFSSNDEPGEEGADGKKEKTDPAEQVKTKQETAS